MTAPVHPGGERWIVDCGDGCTTEFDTEAEAVAYADACIQDWCDEGWMEEVDNIFVARLTHRSQRHVVAVQDEVSEEEWGRVTHGGSGFSEWWEYTIEPLGSTPQAPTVDSGELGPWCCYADEVGVYADGVCTEDDPRHAPTHCGYDNVRRGLVPAPTVVDDGEVTISPEGDRYRLTVQINEAGDAVSHLLTADEVRTLFAAAGVSSDR